MSAFLASSISSLSMSSLGLGLRTAPAPCLKLPAGWKFRSPILEQDLVFMTDNGKTMITQDELGNTYDRTGGPYSNYKP